MFLSLNLNLKTSETQIYHLLFAVSDCGCESHNYAASLLFPGAPLLTLTSCVRRKTLFGYICLFKASDSPGSICGLLRGGKKLCL